MRPTITGASDDTDAKDTTDIRAVLAFLRVPTPEVWFAQSADHLEELLVDHAHCEKKAASTALSLMYRYVEKPKLLRTLSRLAREELRHFEQVHGHLERLNIPYRHLSASRYARELRALVSDKEPERLVDTLLTGAIVEARSCERFAGLAEVLEEPLAGFYRRLLASEARHFENYLDLARRYSPVPIEARVTQMLDKENHLVCAPDDNYRFHSGPIDAHR